MGNYITSIKDLVIQTMSNGSQVIFKANNGDPENCFQVGMMHLLGINTSVDFKKASKYFGNQSLSGDQEANLILAFIAECEGDFSKAFSQYTKAVSSETDTYIDKVIKGRNNLQDFFKKYNIPISLNKEISSILKDYGKGKSSRTGACIKIAAICNDEQTCLEAAKSLFDAKDYISAIDWLKRGNVRPDDTMYKTINNELRKMTSDLLNSKDLQIINLENNSLLSKEDPTPFFNKVKKTCDEASMKCSIEWKDKTKPYIDKLIKEHKDQAYLAALAAEEEAKRRRNGRYVVIGLVALLFLVILFLLIPSSDKETNDSENAETMEVASEKIEEVNSIETNKPEDKEYLKKYLEQILPLATKMGEGEAVKKYFSKEFVDLYNRVEDYDRRNSGEIGFWNSDFWTDRQEGYIKKITVLSVSDINNNKAVVTVQLAIDDYNNNIDNDTRVFNMIFENGKWLIDDYYDYKKNFKIYLTGTDDQKASSSNNNLGNNGSFNILSNRRLSEADLSGMSKKELEIMRNSIYARYGYQFKREDLLDYFSQYSWYNPTTSDMGAIYNQMNDNEKYNIDFIKSHE